MNLLILLFCLQFSYDPFKGVPETRITAPESIGRGKNIVFSVASAERPKELLDYSFTWIVHPGVDDIFSWPDNSKACFGSGKAGDPSDYTITLVATYLLEGQRLQTVKVSTTVHIMDNGKPPPDPKPSDFGTKTFEIFKTLPLNERKAVAQNFRNVANSIKGGIYKSRSEMLANISDLNTQSLQSNLAAWKKPLDDFAELVNGIRPSLSDCILLWTQTAEGLERESP